MARSSLPRLVVFGDPKKGLVAEVIEEFTDFVKGKAEIVACYGIEKCTVDTLERCDYAVVFGGDGSIISAARALSQSNVPVIGVNLGKLGFLAEFAVEELKEFFDKIVSGKATVEKRIMLSCRVFNRAKEKNVNTELQNKKSPSDAQNPEQEKFCSAAINDVFIMAGPPFRMIELKISVDGQPLAGCISDGLIISTPTGSTAYNLSAGGPILSGNMEAMVITSICPHSLSFRPIVINADCKVEVHGVQLNEGTTVSIDGQISCNLSINDVVRVEKAKSDFLVVSNPLRTQWDTLAAKLNWAEKPRYKKTPVPEVSKVKNRISLNQPNKGRNEA